MTNYRKSLKNAVLRQIGGTAKEKREILTDIVKHGADAGFNGFIYYNETTAFYKRHRKNIIELAREYMDSIGEYANLVDFVASFNCLNGNDWGEEISLTLYGKPSQIDTTIANALAWFALEEVAREVCDND